MQEIWVRSLGWEDPLEKGLAPHSNILAWKIPMDRGAWQITVHAAALLQSCSTLYDPIEGSPPGSPVPGILQARTLEWVAIAFSNA